MAGFVVVTGVSTGIGRAAVRELTAHGDHVFGSVRSEADAVALVAEFGDKVTPLIFDVMDTKGLEAAVGIVYERAGALGLKALVNNAGVALGGPLMHQPLDEIRRMFEINVLGLIAVTQAFLPLLGARRDSPHPPGRIVNISSVSGGVTFPFVAGYAASKHAVESLTDGFRRELAIYGIDAVAIEPNEIRTAIWDKAKTQKLDERYRSTDYGPILARFNKMVETQVERAPTPEALAALIRRVIEARRPATQNPLRWTWRYRFLVPARLLDRMVIKVVGLARLGRKVS